MQTPTTEDHVAQVSRLLNWMVIGLAVLVAGISFVAFYMSFAVLQDLAVRSALPDSVAWGLPVIIDGSIVAAILVILAWRMCGRRVVWPWVVLGAFSIMSIVGNGAHTAIAHDAAQGVPLWLAVTFGALPPIGLMTSCELLVRLPKAGDIAAVADADQKGEGAVAQAVGPVARVAPAVAESTPAVAVAETPVPAISPAAMVEGELSEPAVAAGKAVSEPSTAAVATSDSADDSVDASDDTAGIDDDEPSAPVTPLRWAEALPETKAGRIDWLVAQKQAGADLSTKDLAEQFGVSERSIQRYLTEADEKVAAASVDDDDQQDLARVS